MTFKFKEVWFCIRLNCPLKVAKKYLCILVWILSTVFVEDVQFFDMIFKLTFSRFSWIELLFMLIKPQYRGETGVHPVDLEIDGQDTVIASTVSQLNKNICVVTADRQYMNYLFDNSRKCQINLIFSSKHWSFFPQNAEPRLQIKTVFIGNICCLLSPPFSLPHI